jgi:hypothetical protein
MTPPPLSDLQRLEAWAEQLRAAPKAPEQLLVRVREHQAAGRHARAQRLLARFYGTLNRRASGLCGAKRKKGRGICLASPIPGKSRCRFHGGLSTGARTPEGRERCRAAALRRWAGWREGQALAAQLIGA